MHMAVLRGWVPEVVRFHTGCGVAMHSPGPAYGATRVDYPALDQRLFPHSIQPVRGVALRHGFPVFVFEPRYSIRIALVTPATPAPVGTILALV